MIFNQFHILVASQTKTNKAILRSAWNYLQSRGIRDEDFQNKLFYPLVDFLKVNALNYPKNNDFKDAIKKFIDAQIVHENIVLLKDPIRVHLTDPKNKQHRRLDALARILSPNESECACIAIAIINGQIVISHNTPTLSIISPEQLCENIEEKFTKIQEFLIQGILLLQQKSLLLKDHIARATNTLMSLSHSTGMLPKDKQKQGRNKIEDYINSSLAKLLRSVFNAHEIDGLTISQRQALLSTNPIIFLSPNENIELRNSASLHAEQLISKYISELESKPTDKIYVGISKLCCASCRDVLNKNPAVQYRGTHGVTFPRVMDVNTEVAAEHPEYTKLTGIMYPSDSESEDELNDVDEKIESLPTIDDELSNAKGKNSPLSLSSSSLFYVRQRGDKKDTNPLENPNTPPITPKKHL